MNNNDKILSYNKTRDVSRIRERDENSERMLQKINNNIEKDDQKIEKSD